MSRELRMKPLLLRAGAFAVAGAAIWAHADLGTTGPFECAIHTSPSECLICEDCTFENGEIVCGTVIGGIRCLNGLRAVCEMTGNGWETDCVSQR